MHHCLRREGSKTDDKGDGQGWLSADFGVSLEHETGVAATGLSVGYGIRSEGLSEEALLAFGGFSAMEGQPKPPVSVLELSGELQGVYL